MSGPVRAVAVHIMAEFCLGSISSRSNRVLPAQRAVQVEPLWRAGWSGEADISGRRCFPVDANEDREDMAKRTDLGREPNSFNMLPGSARKVHLCPIQPRHGNVSLLQSLLSSQPHVDTTLTERLH
jgi:hypothetical protein